MPMIVAVRISHGKTRSREKLLGIQFGTMQSAPNQMYRSESHRSSQFSRIYMHHV